MKQHHRDTLTLRQPTQRSWQCRFHPRFVSRRRNREHPVASQTPARLVAPNTEEIPSRVGLLANLFPALPSDRQGVPSRLNPYLGAERSHEGVLQAGLNVTHKFGERIGGLDVRHVRPFNVSPNSAQTGPGLRQESSADGLAVSAKAAALIASGSGGGFVRVSYFKTGELLQSLPVGDMTITVVEFINDNHILVVGQGIPALVMTIDLPELIGIARSEVTPGLTPQECAA